MNYRREIDGLRALAVIPVILFHAGFQTFSGGFVGVDVFFVVSGYLITSIILAELDEGQFSLGRFYERRARRILPALFAVLAVCLPVAWLWLLPKDMVDFSRSLAAVPLFASNLLFWTTSGYFDSASELKPLLHTWSLAVEEQYYVLFPVFLLLAWRFGKRAIVLCLAVFLALSLGLAEWAALAKPSAAFYLLPFRGWELLVGALAAFYLANPVTQRPSITASNIGSLTGTAFIGAAVVLFDHQTAFPGLSATIPTVGAVLVILFASDRTLVGRLLSSRPFVGVGLISYSAYLWHQPILVFTRHRSLAEPDAGLLAILCFALLPLSYFTWRFIEQPFRNSTFLSRRQVFLFSFLGSLFFIVSGLAIASSQGLLGRGERMSAVRSIEARLDVNQGLSSKCDGTFTETSDCKTGDAPEIMVWGDSFAMHLVDGLLASNPQVKIIQNTISGCGPFLDVAPFAPPSYGKAWATDCIEANDHVRDLLIRRPSIRYVILSSPFTRYVATGSRLMTREGTLVDGPSAARAAFIKTLDSITAMNKTPVVFSPPPHVSFSTGRCLLKSVFFGSPKSACDFDLSAALTKQAEEITWLRSVGENHKVVFLSQGTCPDGQSCNASQGTTLIYRDGGHLSHEGSQFIGRRMDFYNLVTGTP